MRYPLPSRAATLAVAVLFLLLAAAVLAFRSDRAAVVGQNAMEESALRDYAAFAAFGYAGYAKSALKTVATAELGPAEPFLYGPLTQGPLLSPEDLVPATPPICPGCPRADSIRQYFRVELPGGPLIGSGDGFPDALGLWLADTLVATPKPGIQPYEFITLFPEIAGERWGLAMVVRHDSVGTPLFAYGIDAPPEAFASVFTALFERSVLLPPSLTRGLSNDAMLSLSVRTPDGLVLFDTGRGHDPALEAVYVSDATLGRITVHASVRREMMERLLIGRSRHHGGFPVMLALIGLVFGLILSGLAHLRRHLELVRLRDDFVARVSHELRTPLTQIRMFAETLLLGRLTEKAGRRRALEIIHQEAVRLGDLVEHILQFSNGDRGAITISPEPVDLEECINEIIERFQPVARSRRSKVTFSPVHGLTVEVDRAGMARMLLNLLENAMKYGPSPQTVHVSTVAENGRVQVRVDDEGPGVPAWERSRVFEAFRRLERDSGSPVGGSGIGLSVVHQIAVLHGGTARVEDAPSGGARFVIELPRSRGGADAEREDEERST